METNVDLKMWNIKERNKTVDLVQEFYNYVEEKYRDYVYIYTDGSKEQVAGATAALSNEQFSFIIVQFQEEHLII